jgi:hypothetical protein
MTFPLDLETETFASLMERWEEAYGTVRELSAEVLCADHPELLPTIRAEIADRTETKEAVLDLLAQAQGNPTITAEELCGTSTYLLGAVREGLANIRRFGRFIGNPPNLRGLREADGKRTAAEQR